MIPGEGEEYDWYLEYKGNNSEESHQWPHHGVLVQIKYLPYGPEAPDEVKHDLKHVDFIEQEGNPEGESHKLQKYQSKEYQTGCQHRSIPRLVLWGVLSIAGGDTLIHIFFL